MDKNELDNRLTELRAERERLVVELDKARVEARDDLISGKKPVGTAAALAERIAIVDDAIAESLRVELLRIKASSPQPNISREAKVELDQMETNP